MPLLRRRLPHRSMMLVNLLAQHSEVGQAQRIHVGGGVMQDLTEVEQVLVALGL
jgi:hypothetical protein